ncbi:MAG: chemotaxis-specific protein-glutamate methyltransferase CheB [Alphaproteobacteria bacterium]|nr:chemotaxis-specific protein-glutamate methyltransferase CheB [Alphaproteobacteria bacterium]
MNASLTPPLDKSKISVLLVDDSAVVRSFYKRIINETPDITVVATAGNGQEGVDFLKKNSTAVDVVLMDVDMPVMDGLTALPKLLALKPSVSIIISSGLSERSAELSIRTLALGAKDFIPKPQAKNELLSGQDFKDALLSRIRALAGKKSITAQSARSPSLLTRTQSQHAPINALAIGSSTGGPQALLQILKDTPNLKNVPLFITQHMPPMFTTILARQISETTSWPCVEGKTGEVARPGHAYLAPGDYHLTLKGTAAAPVIELNQNPPENFCRPAVDPMVRSLAAVYGRGLLLLILTGMGTDGAKGVKAVAAAGGTVWAQDEATSVVWGMPGAAAATGLCNQILPLPLIASTLSRHLQGGVR